jgi:hypothetical protein
VVQPVDLVRSDLEIVAKSRASQVLLVGGDDWAINDIGDQFLAQGRAVHRCRDRAEAPFPCNAFVAGRGCPLDRADIDAVVLVRSRAVPDPLPTEMGVVCAVRDGLPVIAAGLVEGSPYAAWTVRVPPGGDVVATCDEAVRT